MSTYKNILIAIDFSPASAQVIDRGLQLAQQNNANVHLVHVIENILPLDFAYEPITTPDWYAETEEHILKHAQDNMAKVREKHQLDATKTEVLNGTPKIEIIQYASDHQIDLIVIGSHGRHGFQRLLGSTANPILHNAHCDVLAVRIHDE